MVAYSLTFKITRLTVVLPTTSGSGGTVGRGGEAGGEGAGGGRRGPQHKAYVALRPRSQENVTKCVKKKPADACYAAGVTDRSGGRIERRGRL